MTAELDRILETAREWSRRGVSYALATVVGVRGSTYRGLAARQLLGPDGTSVGTVSGGCLDQDLHRVAREVIDSGQPRLVEFDLTADDEAIWGWGIGCNGATQLIVEPSAYVERLTDDLESVSRPVVLVHNLDRPGERTVVRPGEPGPLGEAVDRVIADGWHRIEQTARGRTLFEVLGAPRRLVVCGAGHDAVPVVRFGAELGYESVVVDDRRALLAEERFPGAAQFVQAQPAELGEAVDLGPSTSVVIMSHNYLRDLDYLGSCLGRSVAYIGILGPGERLNRLLADLAERGIFPDEHDRDVLHGPAGLDIGAEGPVEIAWAILAEISAVRKGHGGGFLRDRKGPEALRRYHQTTATRGRVT